MSTEQLKADIQQKRAELAQIRSDVAALQREMDGFAFEYNRVIGALEAQLDTIRQQIEALLFKAAPAIDFDLRSVWGSDYESVESQYRRAMDPNAPPKPGKIAKTTSPDELKTL